MRYQQIALLETATGEIVRRRLEHEDGEAKDFYAKLPQPSLIGIEATGYTQWFERMADTCKRLLEKEDIKEFYLGIKEESARGKRRWKKRKTWR